MADFRRIIQRITNSERVETGVADLQPNEICIVEDIEELIYKDRNGGFVSISKDKYKVDNIEDLKKSTKYKIGNVVEVLGYYEKSDRDTHKRVASSYNDGSGVLGVNGLWWNVHNSTDYNNITNNFALSKKINDNISPDIISMSFFGDSTSAGTFINGGYVQDYSNTWVIDFESKLNTYGLNNFICNNLSISGGTCREWSETGGVLDVYMASENFKTDTGCVIRYGLNDALYPNNAQEFRKSLEEGLRKIRNVVGVEKYTIALCSPNTSFQNRKEESYIYSILPIIEEMAFKYKCVYVNMFEIARDFRETSGINNDQIHPDETLNNLYAEELLKTVITPNLKIKTKKNNFINNLDSKSKNYNSIDYAYGIEFNRGFAKDGFPFECVTITSNFSSGILSQKVIPIFNKDSSRAFTRVFNVDSINGGTWVIEKNYSYHEIVVKPEHLFTEVDADCFLNEEHRKVSITLPFRTTGNDTNIAVIPVACRPKKLIISSVNIKKSDLSISPTQLEIDINGNVSIVSSDNLTGGYGVAQLFYYI